MAVSVKNIKRKANLYGTNISETAPTMRIGIRAKHLSVLENEID